MPWYFDRVSQKPFHDFHSAWHWLDGHPKFKDPTNRLSRFREALYIMVSKVDPFTETIEDIKSRNTATRVWLECGAVETQEGLPRGARPSATLCLTHDYDLDCGAPTFEEATLQLAGLVLQHYGPYMENTHGR